jgi:hypothetical protein
MWYIKTFTGPWKQNWLTFSTPIQYTEHFPFNDNVNSSRILTRYFLDPLYLEFILWRFTPQGSLPLQPSGGGSDNTNIVIGPNYIYAPGWPGGLGGPGGSGGGGEGGGIQFEDGKAIV